VRRLPAATPPVEGAVPTRFLSDADLALLSGYPTEIDDGDLVTLFRLEEA